MDIRIVPGALSGRISARVSKSELQRALICSALSDMPTSVEFERADAELSQDILAALSCMEALGAGWSRTRDGILVTPPAEITRDPVLDCRDSATVLRFLLPAVTVLCGSAEFRGSEVLAARPVSQLIEALERCGAVFETRSLPIRALKGPDTGDFEVPGNVSSQFVSGLMLAGALMTEDARVAVRGELGSAGYAEMTARMLRRFGAQVAQSGDGYEVAGQLRSPGSVSVSGDWSGAAALFSAAAAVPGSDVTVTGLRTDSLQADRAVSEILSAMGAGVAADGDEVRVTGAELRGVDIGVDQIPDLFPVLAAAVAGARDVSVFRGCARFRYKESDRIEAVKELLGSFCAVSAEEDGIFTVYPGNAPGTAEVRSFGDHRIVMAAAVAAYALGTETVIRDAECVDKSYPGFFDDLKALGGEIYEI